MGEDWREDRRYAAAEHARALQARKERETEQARRLVVDFVAAARERGIAPEPLVAKGGAKRTPYRTGVVGWHLRQDRTMGVGTDGSFYLLAVPASLRSWLRGVRLEPSDPPLIAGVGGRDGESIPLATLLQRRLDAG